MRLEINKKKTAQTTNTWRRNTMLLNNQWLAEEIKEEIKKSLGTMKMKVQYSKSSSKREVYNDTGLPQETKNSLLTCSKIKNTNTI